MDQGHITVVDIGKTHAKFFLVDADSGELIWEKQHLCASATGEDFRELDIASLDTWLLETLAAAPERSRIHHIVPVAHGATAIWIDAKGYRLAAPDYEDPVFDAVADAYRRHRDGYNDTYSPFLPFGLNLGRQYFFLQTRRPELFERAQSVLLYPQYWAWRLCGVAASEITSLGCHTDLWRPLQSRPSDLSIRQGWERLRPPLRRAGDALGVVTEEIQRATGLNPQCLVYCGMHDSNASYLCHLVEQRQSNREESFSVISSGTWTLALTRRSGGGLSQLKEQRDMLANIDVDGNAVATARFMGGREYAEIAGVAARAIAPTDEALSQVLAKRAFALPCFAPQGGPYSHHPGSYVHAEGIEEGAERATLATLYVALMTDLLLENLGACGAIIVDGPLASNSLFSRVLQALRSESPVYASATSNAAAAAARYLVTHCAPTSRRKPVGSLPDVATLEMYRAEWREQLRDLDARAGLTDQ